MIEHVGCIWDVAFTAHADLVTACADGVARLWTTNAQRKVGVGEHREVALQKAAWRGGRSSGSHLGEGAMRVGGHRLRVEGW